MPQIAYVARLTRGSMIEVLRSNPAALADDPFVDVACRERTALAGCVTVAVDYRLAPEHKFPVPLEDSYAALLWIVRRALRGKRTPVIAIASRSCGSWAINW